MPEAEDKLYKLIHSLDKSEKGFVKKMAAFFVKEEASGARLFDIYNSVPEYNKAKIDKLVQKEKFAGHLSKIKHYLYELILKSLRIYYAEKKEFYNLQAQIQNADILKEKHLFRESYSVLKKAKKTALESEIYYPLIHIVTAEKSLIPTFQPDHTQRLLLVKLIKEEEEHYRYLDEAVRFFREATEKAFYLLYQYPHMEMSAIAAEFDKMISSENYQKRLCLSSKRIKIKHQLILTNSYFAKGDRDGFYRKASLMIDLVLDKKESRPVLKSALVGILNCVAILAGKFNFHNLAGRCMDGMEQIKQEIDDPENHAYIIAETYLKYLRLYYCMVKGEFKGGLQLCEFHLQNEEVADDAINDNLASFYIVKSSFHFLLGQFPEVIKTLNNIELHAEHLSSVYLKVDFLLIKILTHLEMGNVETASYVAKSLKTLMDKAELKFYQRKILVDTLIKNFNASRKEVAAILQKRFAEEKVVKDDSMQFIYIDLDVWSHCALNNIPVKDGFEEEYRKKYCFNYSNMASSSKG
ncbi:MAG: hypothetical protein ACKOXB_13880 [Flavobacteriales bacterium]